MKINSIKIQVLIITLFSLASVALAQGGSSAKNKTNKMNIISFNKYLPKATVDSGYFTLRKEKDTYCIKMTDEEQRNSQHFMIENCFDIKDFKEINNILILERKSGIIEFNKDINEFTFRKNIDFVRFLKKQKIKLNNDLYYFKLFLGDINKDYVLGIKKLGFRPTITELGRLVWHDASINYIEKIQLMFPKFTLTDISMLSAHNISKEYVQSFLDIGIKEISLYAIKKSKKIGLTAETIQKQKEIGNNFSDLETYVRLLKKKN